MTNPVLAKQEISEHDEDVMVAQLATGLIGIILAITAIIAAV